MGSVGQAIGIMQEKVRGEKLEQFFQTDDTFLSELEDSTDESLTSARPMKIPFLPLGAAPAQQTSFDGGPLGLGVAMTTDAGTLVPVTISQAHQYTKLTELTTKSDEQAVENFVTKQMKLAMQQFRERIEALLQGDSSNTLDSVTSVAGNQLGVNLANQFADMQKIDIWSQLGGVFRGTVIVQSNDTDNKLITLTGNAPAGTTVGDLLLMRGSSGQIGTGVAGIKAYHVSTTTGTWLGVPRTGYPGRLVTPNVNAQNQPLTPALARRSIAAVQRKLGIKAAKEYKLKFHLGLDMIAAWENVGITIMQNIYQQVQKDGKTSPDMLQESPPATFAGRPTLVSLHATPGRIDGLCLARWFRAFWQKIDFYDVVGQTVFPQIANDGGLTTNMLFYLIIGFNVGMDNPAAGVFINNVPIPAGY